MEKNTYKYFAANEERKHAPQGRCFVSFLFPFGKDEGSWTFWIYGVPELFP
jgi:hypothetical protein